MKKSLYFIVFLILIIGIQNVYAASNPYKPSGPYGTNCTWYAWKMASEKAGVTLPGWGNAKEWYSDASNDGYSVGTTPEANSIVVWGNWTSYGHVGYVEKVEGNIMYVWDSTGPCIDEEDPKYINCIANGVSEETDKVCRANAKRIACKYTISPSDYEITGYIYLDNAPKKPTSSSSTSTPATTKKEETKAEVKKSNNANLSDIELSVGTIIFDKEVFEYALEVENEVEQITINATTEHKKATIKGIGNYELNVGSNELKLVVTAEDGTTKEYVVKVTRKEKIEEQPEIEKSSNQVEQTIVKKGNEKIIILTVGAGVIILIGLCLIFKFRKRKNRGNYN
ncbi:MAG: CHAP domain-containing protein [Bacilli bacterium]|nr:CHAP domain-containing protein [Bacilli bacterium]